MKKRLQLLSKYCLCPRIRFSVDKVEIASRDAKALFYTLKCEESGSTMRRHYSIPVISTTIKRKAFETTQVRIIHEDLLPL
jgi:hypothetical protein